MVDEPDDGFPDEATADMAEGARVVSISAPRSRQKKKKPPAIVQGDGWERSLLYRDTRDGPAIEVNIHNVSTILLNASELEGAIAFDEFAGRPTITKACPLHTAGTFPVSWADIHDKRAAAWLQASKWRVNAGLELTASCVELVARERTVHPLREKLSAFVWDGKERLCTWLSTYLGTEDTPYHRDVGEKWMISMVARAFQPGCKVDHVLILEGKQRALKSTALRILGIGFFSDEIPDFGTREAAIHIQGVWLVELAELDTLDRVSQNRVKAFVTRTTDRYRGLWDRHGADHPRQCGFAGSTNEKDYLQDPTGARRWWPVEVGTVDVAALERDVSQLWAEAVLSYRNGKQWWLASEEEHGRAASQQADRFQTDVWHESIAKFVAGDRQVTIASVLSDLLEMKPKDQGRPEQMRVAKCLKVLGFERRRIGSDGARAYVYERPIEEPTAQPVGTQVGTRL